MFAHSLSIGSNHSQARKVIQILPLVNLRVFELPKAVATPKTSPVLAPTPQPSQQPDTIIVPAKKAGFEKVFLGEDCWYAIRISGGMLDKIKYIAAYQSKPVKAITHYAPVDRIEPYGDGLYGGSALHVAIRSTPVARA